MTQKAIIHTATRVIRRLTTDDVPATNADETAVEVVTPLDLAGGPWKLALDNQTLTVATTQEIDDAEADPVRVTAAQRQFFVNYLASLDAIEAAGNNTQMMAAVKDWARRHKKLVQGMYR